jgi:hypothetical protein
MTRKTWKISRRRMICRAGWCLYLPAFLPPDPRPRTKKEREREISGPCLAAGSATRRSPTATARCLSPLLRPRGKRKSPAPNRSAPSSDRDPAFERLPCPHRPTCPGSRHQTKPNRTSRLLLDDGRSSRWQTYTFALPLRASLLQGRRRKSFTKNTLESRRFASLIPSPLVASVYLFTLLVLLDPLALLVCVFNSSCAIN